MKKEYLDMLYEQRSATKKEIDDLVEKSKLPRDKTYDGLIYPVDISLKEKREQLFMVNQLIEQYIKIHN